LGTLRHGGVGCISATVNVTSRLARQIYDLHLAKRGEEANAIQQRLTGVRETIEAFPLIPALKGLMLELTKEEAWRNILPPLVRLDEEQVQDLLSRLPDSELL
jgi:4-hydroxy-tetrahydrodipicolinate synthase